LSTIMYLAKFFEIDEHADQFVRGNIYCNTLRKFKKMEDKRFPGRADSDEGTTRWLQPDEVDIQIAGVRVTGLAGPVQVQMNWLNDVHVFCMVAGHTGTLDVQYFSTEDLRQELIIPRGCLDLGQHLVMVTDVTEFINRMDAAVQETDYRYAHGLVKYYDPETFHGEFRNMEAVFRKQDHYSYQREFRFAFETGRMDNHPLTIEIGDISDITARMSSSDLLNDGYVQVIPAQRD